MSRLRSVVFSDGLMFEDDHAAGFVLPANDPVPLAATQFQAASPEPAKVVDPDSGTTHLYSGCYAAMGRWEVTQIRVTNGNSKLVRWGLMKFPSATYKDTTTHSFTRYTGSAPTTADSVDVRVAAVFYHVPLQPGQTFVTPPDFRLIVSSGESLWGCAYPGYPWTGQGPTLTPAGDTTTMSVIGDIVV